MVPEGGCHAIVDMLVSVVVSHVLFLHVLKILYFEVASEMEPEVHRIVEDLGEEEA